MQPGGFDRPREHSARCPSKRFFTLDLSCPRCLADKNQATINATARRDRLAAIRTTWASRELRHLLRSGLMDSRACAGLVESPEPRCLHSELAAGLAYRN